MKMKSVVSLLVLGMFLTAGLGMTSVFATKAVKADAAEVVNKKADLTPEEKAQKVWSTKAKVKKKNKAEVVKKAVIKKAETSPEEVKKALEEKRAAQKSAKESTTE